MENKTKYFLMVFLSVMFIGLVSASTTITDLNISTDANIFGEDTINTSGEMNIDGSPVSPWLYNQSGVSGNIFDQTVNTTSNTTFNNLTITNNSVFSGDVEVVNSFFANLIGSITDRITNLWASAINTFSINATSINSTNINVSETVNVSGEININNAPVSKWLYNETTGNETDRFENLTKNDCPGTFKMIGVQPNGTVTCTAVAGGGDFSFTDYDNSFGLNISFYEVRVNDSYLSTFNATYDVLEDNTHLGNFTDDIDATNRNLNDQTLNTTNNVQLSNITIISNGNVTTQNLTLVGTPSCTTSLETSSSGEVICGTDPAGTSTNVFNQELNTTENVSFHNLTIDRGAIFNDDQVFNGHFIIRTSGEEEAFFFNADSGLLQINHTFSVSSSLGAVGIGVTDPVYALEIAKETFPGGFFGITKTNDGDMFSINRSGSVGINVAVPSHTLNVNGTTNMTGGINLSSYETCTALETVGGNLVCGTDDTGASTNIFDQDLNQSSNATFNNITITNNSVFGQDLNILGDLLLGSVDVGIWFYNGSVNPFDQDLNTTDNVQFSNITSTGNLTSLGFVNLNNTLFVSINGMVGIGTGSPNTNLEILDDDSDTLLRVTGFEAKSATLQLYADENDNVADRWDIESNGTTNDLYFFGRTGGLPFNYLTIQNEGNVGIGTAAPTDELNVVGNGNFTGNLSIGGRQIFTTNETTLSIKMT